ncbi:MAG TPA: aldehyde oxidase, partial [Blastocatellia bacterium]|nr:aldehyde oxidase [Blastocatellia bacterium]
MKAVGENIPRREGVDKVTGSARYIDDISFDGMLYGKTIRSTVPRGRIKSISFDPAFDWSRVVVAGWRDIPGPNIVALIEEDQPLL